MSRGEQTVRALAHRGFVLAIQDTPPLAACATLLVEFTAATAEYGDGLVRTWLDTEADLWRVMKHTSPYSGAPVEAAQEVPA
jgi:hypothetical protein